jgi:putative hydrolase of the HAD superfamily
MMLAAGSVDAVLLDTAGVLLIPDHAVVAARLEAAGIPMGSGDIERAHYAGVAFIDVHPEADPPRPAYLGVIAAELGVPEPQRKEAVAVLFDLWEGEPIAVFSRPCRGVPGGLQRLVDGGIRCAVVSNSDGTVEQQLRTHRICQAGPGPGVRVHAVIDSHVVGVGKPDPAIFHLGLEAVAAAPDRAVYIGDSVRFDIEGARSAGMPGIHFDPFGLCRHDDHDHIGSLDEAADWVLARRGRGPAGD